MTTHTTTTQHTELILAHLSLAHIGVGFFRHSYIGADLAEFVAKTADHTIILVRN